MKIDDKRTSVVQYIQTDTMLYAHDKVARSIRYTRARFEWTNEYKIFMSYHISHCCSTDQNDMELKLKLLNTTAATATATYYCTYDVMLYA